MNRFFKDIISKSTLYYTVLVAVFSTIVLISNSSENNVVTDPTRILLFLPFCIFFAIANTVLGYKNVEAVTRWLVHSVMTILGAFLFIILPAKLETSSGNFMGMILVIVIYIVGVLFFAILNSRIKKSLKQDNELKSKQKR